MYSYYNIYNILNEPLWLALPKVRRLHFYTKSLQLLMHHLESDILHIIQYKCFGFYS